MLNSHRGRRAVVAKNRARLRALILEDRTVPASLVWTGAVNSFWGGTSGVNTNWFNQTTLTNNVLPHNGDDLQFTTMSANHTQSNNISNLIPGSINFSDTDYVISGQAITVDTITDTSSAGHNTLNLPIAGPITVAVNASSTRFTLGGVISGSGALTKSGSGILRLSGAADNTFTGVTTVSAGTLELDKNSGIVAVPGDLTINGGTARELVGFQIASTTVTVTSAGTFDLNNFADTIGPLNVNGGSVTIGTGALTTGTAGVTMTGGSIASTGAGKLILRGGVTTNTAPTSATISGNLDLNGATRTFTVADGTADPDLLISAIISGTFGSDGLTKAGPGKLRLSGTVANTYTGLTTVSAGTLSLSKGAGVAAIAGNVTINGGAAREDLTNQIAATSNVLVISGGIFDVNNLAATIGPLRVSGGSVTIGTGMLTVGSLTMSGGGIASTGTGTLALQGDVTTNTAGFAATISGNLDLGGATHTFDVAEGLPTIDLDISAVITNGGFTKSGGGTLHLSGSGNNTYTGLTTVSAGTLELAKSGGFAFAMGGNLTINNAVVRALADREIGTATTVTVNGGGTFDFNNFDDFMGPLTVNGGSVTIGTGLVEAHLVTMTGGSITSTGTGELDLLDNLTTNQSPVPATISGRLQLQSVLRTFTIADGPAVPDLDISAVVDDFGSNGGLNKTGAGSLLFSGSQANTQTSTTVSAGTLELAKTGGAVAVPVVLTINGGAVRESAGNQIADTCAVNVTTAGTLDLNGQIDTIGPLTLMSGIVTIGTGTLTAGSLTMTGGGIGSTGAGTLVLQGDVTTNIAPAPATISGNLDLGGKTCDFTVNDGAAVPDLDISAVISNGGMFKSGNGTLRLSGAQANTYTGQTSVSGGTLELGKTGGSLAVMGTLGISSGGTVRELGDNQIVDTSGVSVVSSSTQFDLNGFTDAVASLFVAGAGVTIRTGTLMPGTLLMDGGTISSTGAGKLVLQSNVTTSATNNAATITGNLDLGGTTRTFTVGDGATTLDLHIFAVINNGGLTKMGPGTLRLAGPASNAYTGATTVAAGTLELNKGVGSLAVVGDLVINGGTARELAGNQIGDSSNVSVSSGGTFDLNGQTDAIGTVTVTGGTLSFSGTTAGRLTAGNTSLNATSTLVMKLVDTGNSDHISVNGTVVVGGNLQLSVPSAISVGTAIRLIDNNSGSATTGTFAGLPQGAAFFVGGQLFGIGYTGDTGNDVVVTRISGPAVIGTQVNDGAAQRSRVTSLSVSFSAQVTFAGTVESAFTLTHFGGGAVAFTAIAVNFNNRTTVTLNGFTGSETQFGSLADGRYTLTALASQISAGGIQLDGNGDGLAGDNYAFGGAQGLFRFFGDINGDQHVDVADFGLFSSTFNLSTGQTGFLAAFDFNADGHIDIADFGQFSLRFFTVLP